MVIISKAVIIVVNSVNHSRMKVIYINASFNGNIHEIVDSALIGMSVAEFHVKGYAHADRIPCLQKIIDERFPKRNIEWSAIRPIRNTKLRTLKIALREAMIILKNRGDNLFLVSFMNGFSSNLHNLICFFSGAKILLVTHNDAECLMANKRLGFQKTLHRFFFKYVPLAKNLRILVLGDSIIDNLSLHISSKRLKHFVSIDHPYYSNVVSSQPHLRDEINIGLPGRMDSRPSRGFDNLCKFAKDVACDNRIKIHLISSIEDKLVSKLPENVIVKNDAGRNPSREEYEDLIKQMDYILLPYHKDYYKLTASGAVFEAIVNLKPALMFSTDYFQYLSKKYGDFGIFIDQTKNDQLLKMLHDERLYDNFTHKETEIAKAINPVDLSDSFCSLINSLW